MFSKISSSNKGNVIHLIINSKFIIIIIVGIRFSSTAKVWIDKNTKVICQGFTGKQGKN